MGYVSRDTSPIIGPDDRRSISPIIRPDWILSQHPILFGEGGDISSNSYVIEAVGFSDLSDTSELVENLNYKGLR